MKEIPKLTEEELRKFDELCGKGKDPDDCWLWLGVPYRYEYGSFCVGGNTYRAHRVSLFIFQGHLDSTKMVLHSCNNPPCVNPRHLREGTHQDNMDDRVDRLCEESVLTPGEVALILGMKKTGKYTYYRLAALFGVSSSTIQTVVCGKAWRKFRDSLNAHS